LDPSALSPAAQQHLIALDPVVAGPISNGFCCQLDLAALSPIMQQGPRALDLTAVGPVNDGLAAS